MWCRAPLTQRLAMDIASTTDEPYHDAPSASLAWEQEQQQQLLDNQDQALGTLGTSLHVLRSQAHMIGQETDEHALMLGELDADIDRTQSRLQRAMSRMDRFVARADARLGGWSVWILIALLIVLLLLVLIM